MKVTVGTPTNKVEAVYAKNVYADNCPHFPIGAFVPFGGNTSIPVGFLLCNGASVARATYPKLFEILGTTYGAEDDAHFNLPDFTGGTFLEGSETAGEAKEAGLPNIEGKIDFSLVDNKYGLVNSDTVSSAVTGAFGINETTTKKFGLNGGSSQSRVGDGITFDASKSNAIYGNSDTVQPKLVTVRWFVKAFDGASEDSTDLEITNVANDVIEIKNRVYLVESAVNDNGSWYRKYSDGWIEQGGKTANSDTCFKVTLLKAFTTTSYIVTFGGTSKNGAWRPINNKMPLVYTRTTTSFTMRGCFENVNDGAFWMACGK